MKMKFIPTNIYSELIILFNDIFLDLIMGFSQLYQPLLDWVAIAFVKKESSAKVKLSDFQYAPKIYELCSNQLAANSKHGCFCCKMFIIRALICIREDIPIPASQSLVNLNHSNFIQETVSAVKGYSSNIRLWHNT